MRRQPLRLRRNQPNTNSLQAVSPISGERTHPPHIERNISMIRFNNDYNMAAHPSVLKAIAETSEQSYPGYGTDDFCALAADDIRKLTDSPDADVHFFVGATQANFVVSAAALRPIQSVICAETGHISRHETGSVENTGHKLLQLPAADGKITAEQIERCASEYYDGGEPEFLTEPKLVYISFPTEYGTLYSLSELKAIRKVCDKYSMYLFVDGARLGYGLGSSRNDVTPKDLAKLTDVFYFGGTKCGALFGEALVILNENLKPRFKSYMKQNGAVLAKGWLLGLQFHTLLKTGAYFKITKRADEQAMKIKEAFAAKGIPPFIESFTNQQFVILTEEQAEKLAEKYIFEPDGTLPDGRRVVRFCTAWSTPDSAVGELIKDIAEL